MKNFLARQNILYAFLFVITNIFKTKKVKNPIAVAKKYCQPGTEGLCLRISWEIDESHISFAFQKKTIK